MGSTLEGARVPPGKVVHEKASAVRIEKRDEWLVVVVTEASDIVGGGDRRHWYRLRGPAELVIDPECFEETGSGMYRRKGGYGTLVLLIEYCGQGVCRVGLRCR